MSQQENSRPANVQVVLGRLFILSGVPQLKEHTPWLRLARLAAAVAPGGELGLPASRAAREAAVAADALVCFVRYNSKYPLSDMSNQGQSDSVR